MPRFYFHLHNDVDTIDEEGTALPDRSAAIEWAKVEVRAMAAESIRQHSHLVLHHSIRIEDESGEVVATVRFGDVVAVRD
jgi:hypothetical protein